MKPRILIVDDDRDHAESVADILVGHNYEIEIALTGEKALERFRTVDFDVTLMDIRLPGMNGVQTFFEFRKVRPDAQVILMSGFSVEKLISEALNGGALGILHKPFDSGELIKALKAVKPRGLILVADDDQQCAGRTKDVLISSGYRVEVACTGEEAKEKLLIRSCDCLILDLQLPLLSALQVYLGLGGQLPSVPTILLVPEFAAETDFAESVVANRVLVKPFDPAVLLEAVTVLLESHRAAAA